MKQLALMNPDNLSLEAVRKLKLRQAARAIVFDDKNRIALLHVTRKGSYKLPGGGVEAGEDFYQALKRECMEELGCAIEILQEVGMIIEYWGKFNQRQESYCYTARVTGEKGIPHFTDKEMEDGFKVVWTPLNEGVDLLKKELTKDYEGRFMQSRDLLFLEEALTSIPQPISLSPTKLAD